MPMYTDQLSLIGGKAKRELESFWHVIGMCNDHGQYGILPFMVPIRHCQKLRVNCSIFACLLACAMIDGVTSTFHHSNCAVGPNHVT